MICTKGIEASPHICMSPFVQNFLAESSSSGHKGWSGSRC